MKEIKTITDAFKVLNRKPIYPDVSMLPEKDQKAFIASYELTVVADALNEGWLPDWDNWDEYKYYSWFNMDKSGFGFLGTCFVFSSTDVGSRLCFKSRELAKYAATQFEQQYKDYYLR